MNDSTTPQTFWRIVSDKTQDHWLQVEDLDGWYDAYVKWDGCIGFNQRFNTPRPDTEPDDVDSIHICDLDDMIARLQGLREMARKHFGEDWPR